jgi:hypothetical protein
MLPKQSSRAPLFAQLTAVKLVMYEALKNPT